MKNAGYENIGGEGRNRTHPPTRSVGATALKAATTTRHASLSGKAQEGKVRRRKYNFERKGTQRIDLTGLKMASKSGKSPVRSLE